MPKYTVLLENPIICNCANVDRRTIIKSIKEGNKSIELVYKTTRACCCCKSCYNDIQKLIKEYEIPWWKRFINFWKE
jgi:NAD(P)H-nitrite reductase large subunit